MTYPETLQFLYGLRMFGLKFGLENTLQLARLAGNPHQQLRFIHVAGTNGKGSTCAFLENIYRCAGLRTGLFTSPHLVSFRERIQVNRQPIPADDVVRLTATLRPYLATFPADHHPTFFEVVTLLALLWFVEQRCDLVIWETGMGGRLDATNIVTPLASVITPVDLDHQQWLGDTLEKIATEKAGIIKSGVPVISAPQAPEAARVIQQTATCLHAPLVPVPPLPDLFPGQPTPQPAFPGAHQLVNAATATATVQTLQPLLPVNPAALRLGLETAHWPGRLQRIPSPGGGTILLDGAHNPAGATALQIAVPALLSHPPRTLILGLLADKDCEAICTRLAPLADRILCVPVQSNRSCTPQQLATLCAAAHPSAAVTDCTSLAHALQLAQKDPFVIVTGSLYLVGEALELLGASPVAGGNERDLNEWSPAR